MNCCREIAQVGVPPGNRPAYRGIGPEAYLSSTLQGPAPEDTRKDGHIRGRSKPFMKHPGYANRSITVTPVSVDLSR
jgi:hypothetical protein